MYCEKEALHELETHRQQRPLQFVVIDNYCTSYKSRQVVGLQMNTTEL